MMTALTAEEAMHEAVRLARDTQKSASVVAEDGEFYVMDAVCARLGGWTVIETVHHAPGPPAAMWR